MSSAAPLVVIRGDAGTGKTALLAQWAHAAHATGRTSVIWIGGDDAGHSRTGFWMRVLARMHEQRLLDDQSLYREMAALADHPSGIVATMRRILAGSRTELTLLLDDVGPLQGESGDEVAEDLTDLLESSPTLRCIAASSSDTPLGSHFTRTRVGVELLDDEDLALTVTEILTLARHTLPDAGPPVIAALEQIAHDVPAASRRIALVKFTLSTVQNSPRTAGAQTATDVLSILEEATRHALRTRFTDPAIRDVLRLTVQAPAVDAALAQQLTGNPEAHTILDDLARRGAGQWVDEHPEAAPIFEYSAPFRTVAIAEYPLDAHQKQHVHLTVARWLATTRGDRMGAVEHAIRADDLAYAAQLLMRLYPFAADESRRLSALLRDVPRWKIHRHPMLALWFALALNKDPSTQKKAIAYFLSATLMLKVAPRAEPHEQAVLAGLGSSVQRMLGRPRPMADHARRALALLETIAEDPERDRDLDGIVLTAMGQSATSLMYADELDEALAARRIHALFARSTGQLPQRNVAFANIALIHVLAGDYRDAERALAEIDPAAWPDTWRDSYRDSPEHIARAYILISRGRHDEALATIDRLAPHKDTIEHWDLIASATALAQAATGSVHRAQAEFHRFTAAQLSDRTLPSSQRRLAVTSEMLGLAANGAAQYPQVSARRSSPASIALAALSAHAGAQPGRAVELLAAADLAAHTTLHRLFVAIAGVSLAQRPGTVLDLAQYARRVSIIVGTSGLQWPLLLLPLAERERMVAALRTAGDHTDADTVAAACQQLPPILESPLAARAAPHLTGRERDVLLLLVETDRRSEIAQRLFVSINTVKAQLRSLYAKLGASNRDDALAKASSLGLLRPAVTLDETIAGASANAASDLKQ